MKIKFVDETILNTTTPVEQKVFGNDGSMGWIIGFSIVTPMTSDEIDNLLTVDNIEELKLISDDEAYTKTLTGYDKITMAIVRYDDDISSTVEVQFSKGI